MNIQKRRILKNVKQLLKQNNSITPSSFTLHTTDLDDIR